MIQARAQQRSIPGAVATVGVNERVAFLRRVYGHLAVAIVAFIAVSYVFQQSSFADSFTRWAFGARWNWLIVLGAFMVVGVITERMARSDTSVGMQYLGLALGVVAEGVIITPLIFGGLTATVFLTRKDFSFLRGILSLATLGAFGIILASILFGFTLGTIFCVAMIVLMGGWILYQTSLLMAYFRPTQHVAGALMLFSTIATLFWYVLQLLMS